MPEATGKPTFRAADENITARIAASASFRLKYQWLRSDRLLTSPTTRTRAGSPACNARFTLSLIHI